MCKQYPWRSWEGASRTFSGGRKEQGGVWFSLVFRESLPKRVTFQLRPAGISQVYGGGWREHSCLGQELVLEAARRPEKTRVVRTLGSLWGRGWEEEDTGQMDWEDGTSEDSTQTLESSTIWEVRWQWAENPSLFLKVTLCSWSPSSDSWPSLLMKLLGCGEKGVVNAFCVTLFQSSSRRIR